MAKQRYTSASSGRGGGSKLTELSSGHFRKSDSNTSEERKASAPAVQSSEDAPARRGWLSRLFGRKARDEAEETTPEITPAKKPAPAAVTDDAYISDLQRRVREEWETKHTKPATGEIKPQPVQAEETKPAAAPVIEATPQPAPPAVIATTPEPEPPVVVATIPEASPVPQQVSVISPQAPSLYEHVPAGHFPAVIPLGDSITKVTATSYRHALQTGGIYYFQDGPENFECARKLDWHKDDAFTRTMSQLKDSVLASVAHDENMQGLLQKTEWSREDRASWERGLAAIISEEVNKIPAFSNYSNKDPGNSLRETPLLLNDYSRDLVITTGFIYEFDCKAQSAIKGLLLQGAEDALLARRMPDDLNNLKCAYDYYNCGAMMSQGKEQPAGHAFIVSSATGAYIEATQDPDKDTSGPYFEHIDPAYGFRDFISGRPLVAGPAESRKIIFQNGSLSAGAGVLIGLRKDSIDGGKWDQLAWDSSMLNNTAVHVAQASPAELPDALRPATIQPEAGPVPLGRESAPAGSAPEQREEKPVAMTERSVMPATETAPGIQETSLPQETPQHRAINQAANLINNSTILLAQNIGSYFKNSSSENYQAVVQGLSDVRAACDAILGGPFAQKDFKDVQKDIFEAAANAFYESSASKILMDGKIPIDNNGEMSTVSDVFSAIRSDFILKGTSAINADKKAPAVELSQSILRTPAP